MLSIQDRVVQLTACGLDPVHERELGLNGFSRNTAFLTKLLNQLFLNYANLELFFYYQKRSALFTVISIELGFDFCS